MENQVEELLNHLTNKVGLTITQIADDIDMPRTRLYYRMKSMGNKNQEDLVAKLLEKYPEHFPGGAIPKSPKQQSETEIHLRYIETLEQALKDARKERDRLVAENERLLQEIKDTLKKMNQ